MLVVLALLAVFVLLVVPALAIYTFVRGREQQRVLDRLSEASHLLSSRLQALDAEVRRLERRTEPLPPDTRVDAAPSGAPVAAPEPPSVHIPATDQVPALRPDTAAPPPAIVREPRWSERAAVPRRAAIDWESLIAGRWLNVIGIAALLLAVAFFLRYAFENEWIGPTGRVAIGLVAGAALLAASERLFRAGHRFFSDGIAGLGGGVLYLSIYAAWGYYQIVPQAAAFAGMTGVTLALMLLAAGRHSEFIALVALAGGFSAPVLLSSGTDRPLILFSYLAALDTGALALARVRRWRIVPPVAFGVTQFLFWGWYFGSWDVAHLVTAALFATLYFVLFAAASFDALRRAAGPQPVPLVLILSNAFAYLFALRAMLWPSHRWLLTAGVLALAAAHLAVARLATPQTDARVAGVPLMRVVYAGLALTFATLAIPIRLEGQWITIAWAVEGAVLVWSGVAARVRPLRAAGLVLLGVAVFRLLAIPIPAERFLANPRFLTLVTVALCLVAAVWFARTLPADAKPSERPLYAAAAVAANLLAIWALTVEAWEAIGRMDRPLGLTPRDLRQLALPVVWMLYGTALAAAGLITRVTGLRWMGLPIVGMAAGALLVQAARPETVLLNPRAAAYAVAVLSVFAIGRLAQGAASSLAAAERPIYRAAPVVCNLLLLVGLSHEVWDLFGQRGAPADVRYAQTMGLSILWAGYATALILAGVRTAEPLLRWMALLLFGIVVIKVFFFDLSALDRGYRILSFFVLGVLLLGVSFVYTRRLAAARGGGGT